MLYRIVGIDPGVKTGLTAFTIKDDEISLVESYELYLIDVGHYLDERGYEFVAYELANKFQASGHVSSEIIGLVKYFPLIKGKDIHPVAQASWKRLIKRDVLKRAGLAVPGTHAKDAAGIALFAAVELKLISPWFLRTEET